MAAATIMATMCSTAGGVQSLADIYDNAAYQCAADRCPSQTTLCTQQTGCNAVLACRESCYDAYPLETSKLSLVNCLESCPAHADSTGSALYAQFENCYNNLCEDGLCCLLCLLCLPHAFLRLCAHVQRPHDFPFLVCLLLRPLSFPPPPSFFFFLLLFLRLQCSG